MPSQPGLRLVSQQARPHHALLPELPAEKMPHRRIIRTMPADIRMHLAERNLTDAFRRRPEDQKQSYLAWIEDTRFSILRTRRIRQMLDELERGDLYMSGAFSPDTPTTEQQTS